MKRLRAFTSLAFLLLAILSSPSQAQQAIVEFDTLGGDAWTYEKRVSGRLAASRCDQIRIESPRENTRAHVAGDRFHADVSLAPGTNRVVAICSLRGREIARTAPQTWQVRLSDSPRAFIRSRATGKTLILDAGGSSESPASSAALSRFEWIQSEGNPAPLRSAEAVNCTSGILACREQAELLLPKQDGEYKVSLRVTDSRGRRDESTTSFEIRNGRFEAIDQPRDHPAWVDRAVLYGVVPFFFGGFDGVRERLDEIAGLGATAIWISPVTATTDDDFGYAPIDHFRLRSHFGSEAAFRALVRSAHDLDLRVIIDFVPNHFSERHPYYVHAEQHGVRSPYYDWFDRNDEGEATGYFDWSNLKNLNYDHEEVQRHIIEAFAHWIREYDIDGFRVDASWGVAQRAPEFWPRLRAELKRIKPDIFLLAEASARDPYFVRNGFDAAYDWTDNLGEWAWRDVFHDPKTVPDLDRLRAALTNGERGFIEDSVILRFLNNNDTGARFVTRFGLPYTRLASTLLFTLPGIPLIYNGDEMGAEFEPYDEGPPIVWKDDHELVEHYRQLAKLRAQTPALRTEHLRVLETTQDDRVLAYERVGSTCSESVLVLLNFGAADVRAGLRGATVASSRWRNLLTGEITSSSPTPPRFDLRAHSSLILQPAGGC